MNQQSDDQLNPEEMTLIYTGDDAYQPDAKEQKAHRLYPYMPSEQLRRAVNLAIYLKRPLLIKGEPGSGKTRLAYAVANEFSKTYYKQLEQEKELKEQAQEPEGPAEPLGDSADDDTAGGGVEAKVERFDPFDLEDDKGYPGWPFFFWPVKSTSRAQDGLYVYDAVGRLHNATLPPEEREKKEIIDYIEFGPLGKAFLVDGMRPIVLIDEIDKADIDFPNDLLIELEDPTFKVKELKNQEIKSDIDPIIFVTSNDEKDLPDAFLRRCIFFYIRFPEKEDLETIIKKRVPDHDDALVKKAVEVFMKLRLDLKDKKGTARKLPSTSELIDWVKVLHRNSTTDEAEAVSAERLQELQGEEGKLLEHLEGMDHGRKLMTDQVENLLDGQLPFLSVLFKNYNDYQEYLKEQKELREQKKKQEQQAAAAGGPGARDEG